MEIGNSVATIGSGAFRDCPSLESFTGKFTSDDHRCLVVDGVLTTFAPAGLTSYVIPNSVTEIGTGAFQGTALTSVVIPNSVETIGNDAFQGCTALTSLEIGNSVETIGTGAFRGCSGLTSLVIPNSVETIGELSFADCTGLTSLVIGNSVKAIGDVAFRGCSSLTSLEIPNSVETIGNDAFARCTGLTSLEIPNSVKEIGGGAFADCSGLNTVMMPNSVVTIGNDAFSGCKPSKYICDNEKLLGLFNVKDYGYNDDVKIDIVIGNSVTRIRMSAFSNYTALASVQIPSSVTTIDRTAFQGCTGLKEVISLNTTPPSAGRFCFNKVPFSTCVLKVPAASVEAYMEADEWKNFQKIVGLTDEEIEALPVESVSAEVVIGSEKTYSLSGQPVGSEYKGIVIKGGKKMIKR